MNSANTNPKEVNKGGQGKNNPSGKAAEEAEKNLKNLTMKSKLIFILIGFFVNSTIGQNIDTSLVLKNLKLLMFKEVSSKIWNEIFLVDYFNRSLTANTLESKGFDNLIFFRVNEQVLAVDSFSLINRIIVQRMVPCVKSGDDCYFVYVYNKRNGMFYGIKGVKNNEFYLLYEDLQYSWIGWKPVRKIKNSTIRKFVRKFWVEGVDLECLMKSLKGKNGSCLDLFSPYQG